MKYFLGVFFLFSLNISAQQNFHISNEFSFNYNNIDGSGKSKSSLTQGINYLDILNLYGDGNFNNWQYSYSMGLKATDDKRNDVKNISLVNLNANITNGIHTLKAGDVFETFTKYSMLASFKGLDYNFTKENLPEFKILYGLSYPRWDSVWKDKETRTIKRKVFGSNLRYRLTDDILTGFNYVTTRDSDRQNSTDVLYDNDVYSFNVEYTPIEGLDINAEHANSDTDQYSNTKSSYKDNATRIEIVADGAPSKVTLEYEKVGPDFSTLMGAAVNDRKKFKYEWIYDYSKRTKIRTSFLWFRNNLDSQLTSTTYSLQPQIGMSVKRIFPKRKRSYADIYYKFDRQYNATQSVSNHMLNLSYRDRFYGIDNNSSIMYVLYKTENNITKSHEFTFNTSFNKDYYYDDYSLRPSLNFGTWRSRDELSYTTDIMYEYSLGMGFDYNPSDINGDIRLGANKLNKETGTDSSKFFASLSLYWRVKNNLKISNVFLRAGYNDYAYDGSGDFRETSVTVGINSEF